MRRSAATGRRAALLTRMALGDSVGALAERVTDLSRRPMDDGIEAGVRWLCESHDVTGRRGSSRGYSLLRGWDPPFPETTGYVIGTLLTYGRDTPDADCIRRAQEMGDWEIEVQCADGGVMEGLLSDTPKPSTVFNTGMVIHGWLDLHDHASSQDYLAAAERGAAFLRKAQDEDGAWRGEAEYFRIPHTYCSRVSWALLRLAEATGEAAYGEAARRQLDWVVRMQRKNGWFDACAFKPGIDPNTHGMAYTLRGLLEAFALTGHEAYLEAVKLASEVLVRKLEVLGGRLPASFDSSWTPSASYECLTGIVQLGGVWLRLYELDGDPRFLNAGLKAVDRAAGRQMRSSSEAVHGALAGSYPVYGRYAPLLFPNWATKFLVDSLVMRARHLESLA